MTNQTFALSGCMHKEMRAMSNKNALLVRWHIDKGGPDDAVHPCKLIRTFTTFLLNTENYQVRAKALVRQ